MERISTQISESGSMGGDCRLRITQRSAWFMIHQLLEAWKENGTLFPGPIEVDETLMGASC